MALNYGASAAIEKIASKRKRTLPSQASPQAATAGPPASTTPPTTTPPATTGTMPKGPGNKDWSKKKKVPTPWAENGTFNPKGIRAYKAGLRASKKKMPGKPV